jgi:CRISPR-associated protein Csm4
MQTVRFTIQPQTAFGTPLVGDTLFGQLCWALRHRFGETWLTKRLQHYCEGRPFLVVSDGFPHGFLPLPTVPSRFFNESREDRKVLKKKRWLPLNKTANDFKRWQELACSDQEAARTVLQKTDSPIKKQTLQVITSQPHNTINRATGTTGEDMFAPYNMSQIWFHPSIRLDLYAVVDEEQLTLDELTATLTDIGTCGYGRDAGIGLGKFTITDGPQDSPLPQINQADTWLTLAPCAPQKLDLDGEKSFYRPITRFGRHGSTMALGPNPFKRPILLAATGSIFTPANRAFDHSSQYIGQGLTNVSTIQPEAVSQGYAPVLAIRMEV